MYIGRIRMGRFPAPSQVRPGAPMREILTQRPSPMPEMALPITSPWCLDPHQGTAESTVPRNSKAQFRSCAERGPNRDAIQPAVEAPITAPKRIGLARTEPE